jgi:uncharacterized protein (DUF2141 family)
MSRKYLLIVFLLSVFFSASSYAQSSISLTVYNLRNTKGHLLISLFNSKKGFPDKADNAFRKERITFTGSTANITFTNLPAGQYAIALLHDENDDLKMNSNFFGVPKEGYGFSKNVTGFMGPPSFTDASFTCVKALITTLSIRIKY